MSGKTPRTVTPGPAQREEQLFLQSDRYHHVLFDLQAAFICAVPTLTKDPHGRQLAYAMQFRAAPPLLAAAKAALPLINSMLGGFLEGKCDLSADLQPQIETLDDAAKPFVQELLHAQELLIAAILLAEGD